MRAPRTGRSSTEVGDGQDLAVEALMFLAGDPSRLDRFLAATGLGPHNLRQAATNPGFSLAVLDYLAADQRLVVAFATETDRKPEDVMRVIEAVRGPSPESST